jgi:hypothetical protein
LVIAKKRQEAKAIETDKSSQNSTPTSNVQQECEKIEEYNKKGMARDLFKKIKYFRGQFTSRNGIITDQHGKYLSNGDEIKNK